MQRGFCHGLLASLGPADHRQQRRGEAQSPEETTRTHRRRGGTVNFEDLKVIWRFAEPTHPCIGRQRGAGLHALLRQNTAHFTRRMRWHRGSRPIWQASWWSGPISVLLVPTGISADSIRSPRPGMSWRCSWPRRPGCTSAAESSSVESGRRNASVTSPLSLRDGIDRDVHRAGDVSDRRSEADHVELRPAACRFTPAHVGGVPAVLELPLVGNRSSFS